MSPSSENLIIMQEMGWNHRYLMTRLRLQVVYLWRHVSSTAPPFILWWSNLEILLGPLHRSSPFTGELRCQAIQMEHSPYIAERTQNAVYIVRCLWLELGSDMEREGEGVVGCYWTWLSWRILQWASRIVEVKRKWSWGGGLLQYIEVSR
jgi:hypothetical protein